MKLRLIKGITLVLAAVMLALSFPVAGNAEIAQASGKKAEEYSANTYIAGRLQILFDRLVYSSKPYFTATGEGCGNTHCESCLLGAVCAGHPNLKDLGITYETSAYGSAAFARFAYTLIYGKNLATINYYGNTSTLTETQTIGRVASGDMGIIGSYDDMSEENLRAIVKLGTAGDLIQARSSRGQNHTMVYLKYDDEGVWVLHSIDFGDDTASYNRVVISMYTYAEMTEKWDRVISLLRADAKSYSAAYEKGEHGHSTHTYSDEEGGVCVICGEEYVPTVSLSAAGVYKAKADTDAYFDCYRSKAIDGMKIAKGAYAQVVGSVKNALGVTYYILANAAYAAAEDFVTDTADVPKFEMTQYPEEIWTYGEGCPIVGNVRGTKTIKTVTGYIANAKGEVVQKQSIETAQTNVSLASSAINRLTFGTLPEGKYVFLLTAEMIGGGTGAFKTEFEVRKPLIKPTPATPSAPTLKEKTDTTVHLSQNDGYEYMIEGGEWQTSAEFSGLSPATTYKFYRRTEENEKYKASAASPALTVRTDKSTVAAPAAPSLRDKSDTMIALNTKVGEEYSVDDGATWRTSGEFTGLAPGQTYRFIARYAETATTYASAASTALTVKTEKSGVAAPSAPTLKEKTDTTVTVSAQKGQEYSIDGGVNWQSDGIFRGLTPGTNYSVVARYAETATAFASPAGEELRVKTDKSKVDPPPAPLLQDKSAHSVTVRTEEGLEYSIDGGKNWKTSGYFDGLEPATEYQVVARRAESERNYASSAGAALTVRTSKSTVPAPGRPEAQEIVGYKITVKPIEGAEYRIGDGVWQKSNIFEVDTYGAYAVYARYAETEKNYAGPASEALKITVNPLSLTSEKAKVDEKKLIVGGVSAGMTVGELYELFPESAYLTVCTADGKEASKSARIRTGMRLVLKGGKEYGLAVNGDASGDGQINVFDLTMMKNEILSGNELKGAAFAAADVNKDGSVDVFDYVLLKNSILGGEAV